jgi:hypothetical protein
VVAELYAKKGIFNGILAILRRLWMDVKRDLKAAQTKVRRGL